MRKICIVTFYNGVNYGSKLQATALTIYLRSLGYDVYIFKSFRVALYFLKHPMLIIARCLNRLNRNRRKAFFEKKPYQITEGRKNALLNYNKEVFQELEINNMSMWKSLIDSDCVFVAGSDIIWQPANGIPAHFFLDFACDTKLVRFSYASSLGSLNLPSKYYWWYRRYLKTFEKIGVRENAAAVQLSTIVGREVEKVVDPTLLLSRETWEAFSKHSKYEEKAKNKRYILCYFVMEDERYWDYVKKAYNTLNIEIVVLPMKDTDERGEYTIIEDGVPYDFVSLIKNAELVITDSFHACVFSLIFEKEFYLLRRKREDENDKYAEFLKTYNLENRRVKNEAVFLRMPDIDYSFAKEALFQEVKKSKSFITDALKSY